jgi:type II secretory pathway pseudopilin PulG
MKTWEQGAGNKQPKSVECACEQGFMLLGLIVAIFIILLALSVAAPVVARNLRRDRELEAVHRGNQYVRAIQLYYRKSGSYPGTMDALAKGTPVKFLRQQYVDPFTGKSDWRLIHVGEAKTTVKGFFGQPLTGMAPGLGSAAGAASSGSIGAGAAGSGSAFGGSSGSAFGGASGSSGSAFGGSSGSSGSAFGGSSSGSSGSAFGGSSGAGTTSGAGTSSSGTPTLGGSTTGTDSSAAGATPTSSNGTLGSIAGNASQSASSFTGGGAPFVGVGIPKEGTSIVVLNEQTSYNTWEFIYDPRIEQLKAAAGLMGGGNSGLGSAGGMSSGVGGAGGPGASGFGSSGTSGFGSSGSSGFGSSSGSSFGSSPGSGSPSGFGSSPSSGTQGSGTSTPTTPQQPQ